MSSSSPNRINRTFVLIVFNPALYPLDQQHFFHPLSVSYQLELGIYVSQLFSIIGLWVERLLFVSWFVFESFF